LKNIFLKDLIVVARKYIKTRPDVEKYLFYGLDSGSLEMHQNTSLTTPDVEKYLF
jgi:hypothetical protein